MLNLLEVALPLNLSNTYDYLPPSDYSNDNLDELIGKRVVVKIQNKLLTGVVVNTKKDKGSFKYKQILEVLDENPIFDQNNIKLLKWVSDYYIAPLGEVYKTAFPLGLSKSSKKNYFLSSDFEEILNNTKIAIDLDDLDLLYRLKEKVGFEKQFNQSSGILINNNIKFTKKAFKKFVDLGVFTLNEELKQVTIKQINIYSPTFDINNQEVIESLCNLLKRSKSQLNLLMKIIDILNENNLEFISETDFKNTGFNKLIIKSLVEKGLLVQSSIEKSTITKSENVRAFSSRKNELNFDLNEEQKNAYEAIKSDINSNSTFLLYGVTGSGKTLIYLKLIQDLIDKYEDLKISKKRVLLLLPEISLTPQMIERFEVAFPNRISVLHSKLTDNERYENWIDISNSKYDIVIGVRSAVFAPIKDLGLIIVDEEHDSSYKQEGSNNNYQARDVAIVRGKMENCPVLLGSATPSIESYYNAINNKYKLLHIFKRNDGATLPDFLVVDKSNLEKNGQYVGLFSRFLIEQLSETAQKNQQAILFLNRRGYAPIMECESCGQTESCPNCDIKLTYHKKSPHFQCHCCGFTLENIKKCSYCNHNQFKIIGFGTQRIEEDLVAVLNQNINQINAVRLDADSGNSENKLKSIIEDFENQKYNVLIGTQMISKGLDFENVTLVGLLNPDLSLQFNDFRAAERTYQLLTQVSGRAGRSADRKGKVVIQTKNQNHYSIQAVIENNPKLFYDKELNLRENTQFPPFYRVYKIDFKSNQEMVVLSAAKLFFNLLPKSSDNLIIFHPVTPVVAYIAKTYRIHLIVKVNKNWDKSGLKVNKLLSEKVKEFWDKYNYSNLKIKIDVDAHNIVS